MHEPRYTGISRYPVNDRENHRKAPVRRETIEEMVQRRACQIPRYNANRVLMKAESAGRLPEWMTINRDLTPGAPKFFPLITMGPKL